MELGFGQGILADDAPHQGPPSPRVNDLTLPTGAALPVDMAVGILRALSPSPFVWGVGALASCNFKAP